MSVTFNSNNNYSVEIITESNLGNISSSNGPGEGIQFSATTNTPFVTLKIIPTNSQGQPVLASNIKINDIIYIGSSPPIYSLIIITNYT